MAKKSDTPKRRDNVGSLLNKRVVKTSGKGLGRDVKSPKWLKAIGSYFKGAAYELSQVKWPTRRATWSFTFAVIIFTLAISAFILVLDYGFEQLFKQVVL